MDGWLNNQPQHTSQSVAFCIHPPTHPPTHPPLPLQVFKFIARACPGYVTGPFLARLQEEGGVRLKAKHVIQLVEAGATSKEDLLGKIVDLLEHQVTYPPTHPPTHVDGGRKDGLNALVLYALGEWMDG